MRLAEESDSMKDEMEGIIQDQQINENQPLKPKRKRHCLPQYTQR